MLRVLLLRISRSEWLKRELPRFRFFRRAVSRFMPGETLDDALAEAQRLKTIGAATIVTPLGENVTTPAEATQAVGDAICILEEIRRRDLPTELSLKLTHLGLDLDSETALKHLQAIVETARRLNGGVVWIDMESSAYVDATLELFRRIRQDHPNVGLCLQAYLYRTAADLESLLPFTSTLRLVKGAYAEPKSVAFPAKSDVDKNFFQLAIRMLESGPHSEAGRPAIATHDERLIRRIQLAARERGVDRSAYEFQMLYGIRTEFQRQLVREQFNLKVLISYGSEWFPWYVRRLAERPANIWFVLRNLFN